MNIITKRALLLAVILMAIALPTAAIALAQSQSQPQPAVPTPQVVQVVPTGAGGHSCPRGLSSVAQYRRYARAVYHRSRISTDAHRRLAYMLVCQRGSWARREVSRYRIRFRRERVQHKQMMALTPFSCSFGRSAIPCQVVYCESHGSWNASNSSGARGPYQLLGHGEPWPVRDEADKIRHHEIARALYRQYGLEPWAASASCWS